VKKVLCFPKPDHSKRDALVVEHLKLVSPIARHIVASLPRSFELDDLISAGYVGLIDAAAKFDPKRGIPFGAYARTRIRGEIFSSIRRHEWENATMPPLEEWHKEIADPASEPEAIIQTRQLRKLLESAIGMLSPQEETTIKTKYFQNSDLNGAARKLKLCPSRASQLHCDGLKHLKKNARLRNLNRAA
jgi:RNA polymerase sigma factor (sigma-70 family)